MNREQAEEFHRLLEEACNRHIQNGGEIIAGYFDRDKGLCPLSCLNKSSPIMGVQQILLRSMNLSITNTELWTFIDAFDGNIIKKHERHFVSAILIGKALRSKYIIKE